MIDHLLRGVSLVGGIIACYASLFLYEDEQRQVQNILENWWVRIDDLRRDAISRHLAFAIATSEITGRFLTRLFGSRLLSVRAAGTSLCLSFASFAAFFVAARNSLREFIRSGQGAWLGIHANEIYIVDKGTRILLWAGGWATLCLLLALLRPFRWSAAVGGACLWCVIIFYGATLSAAIHDLPLWGLFLSLGIIYTLGALAMLRLLIRWQISNRSGARTYMVGACTLLLVPALTILPLAAGLIIYARGYHGVGLLIAISSENNIGISAVMLVFPFSAVLLGVHWFVWPLLERPLYRLCKLGVLQSSTSRAGLFLAGAAAVAVGSGAATQTRDIFRFLFGAA